MQRVRLLLPGDGQRRLLQLTLACAACALLACSPDNSSGEDAAGCKLEFVGDRSKPTEMQVLARDSDGHAQPLSEGGDVALVFPPQGGRVIFVGPRVTNIDPCYVKITGALREESTSAVRVDVRTVNLTPTNDGWAQSLDTDISSFANIPACPNSWSGADVFDQTYSLELTITDRTGTKTTKTMHVVPRCAEPAREAECRCICAEGYVLGQACTPTDAGSDAASDAAGDATSDAESGP